MSDRLTLARAIEDAGIERSKAERVASVIFDAIHDNVATKADVAAVTADLRRAEITLKADIAAVRADLTLLEHRMLITLSGVVFTAAGVVIAAIRYLPPLHGG